MFESRAPYEAPTIEVLGTLSEMTLGDPSIPDDSDGTYYVSDGGIPGGGLGPGLGVIP